VQDNEQVQVDGGEIHHGDDHYHEPSLLRDGGQAQAAGMRLNHLDLQVCDVPATISYFERYFGLTLRTKPDSAALAVLTDGHGFVLVLQRLEQPLDRYPDGFHLGFLLDEVESVRALHARAKEGGAEVSDLIVNGRGTMIYFTAPEGYRVEVSCQRVNFRDA
jgi:catechol 2,3-dioxygenase-like lactoylglutathione lyase family enzyme